MSRYKKARWWTLWPCGYTDTKTGEFEIYGVKINYGDWCGKTHLMHDAKMLISHPRIVRKDRDWLRSILEKRALA
jgi:hypothetical protein